MTCQKPFSLPVITFTLMAIGWPSNDARAQTAITLPDSAGQSILIRNTIVAVNHGNLTGNYTVLRDLASENFRQKNSAADLAMTFTNLREQKLDLSPILVTKMQLSKPPGEDKARGRMQLIGTFDTRPQAVHFALIFQSVNGGWMIDEVSIAVAPADPVVKTQHQAPASKAAPFTPSSRPAMSSRTSSSNATMLWRSVPANSARR